MKNNVRLTDVTEYDCVKHLNVEMQTDRWTSLVSHLEYLGSSPCYQVGKTKDNRPIWLQLVTPRKLELLYQTESFDNMPFYAVYQGPDETAVIGVGIEEEAAE
jgi:hypothetical protein